MALENFGARNMNVGSVASVLHVLGRKLVNQKDRTTVKFHEYSVEYYWHIPSATVRDRHGRVVATNCGSLQIARKKVNNGGR
jgi:hypothetical protein